MVIQNKNLILYRSHKNNVSTTIYSNVNWQQCFYFTGRSLNITEVLNTSVNAGVNIESYLSPCLV